MFLTVPVIALVQQLVRYLHRVDDMVGQALSGRTWTSGRSKTNNPVSWLGLQPDGRLADSKRAHAAVWIWRGAVVNAHRVAEQSHGPPQRLIGVWSII